MFQWNKILLTTVSAALAALLSAPLVSASDAYPSTKTTTVEQTTQTTTTVPQPVNKNVPITATPSNTTTSTHTDGPFRKVLDQDALKKMSESLCVKGFKAYVGNDKKNLCESKATSPDLAYSCVWSEAGNAAYAPTPAGPCSLEDAEHRQSVIVTKTDYAASPPLPYGTEAQCCFRAAQGPATTTIETHPTRH